MMSVNILYKTYDIETIIELTLHKKDLTSIPKEIENLTNLQGLYLHFNKLTSNPTEIGNLTNLQKSCLNNNEIISIPVFSCYLL